MDVFAPLVFLLVVEGAVNALLFLADMLLDVAVGTTLNEAGEVLLDSCDMEFLVVVADVRGNVFNH